MDQKSQQAPKAEAVPTGHSTVQVDELERLAQKWEDLEAKLEAAERNNESLRSRVQDLLAVVLRLTNSVMVWKCATGFFAIALIAVIFASLFMY